MKKPFTKFNKNIKSICFLSSLFLFTSLGIGLNISSVLKNQFLSVVAKLIK